MMTVVAPVDVSCAVEVFLATALLHKEQPGRPGFMVQEIVRRAGSECITGRLRRGVAVHASLHCVANKAPNDAKHCMLFATGKSTRRLLLPGDAVHPSRTGKMFPEPEEVPERYLALLSWAKNRYQEALEMTGNRSQDLKSMIPPPEYVPPERRPLSPPPVRSVPDRGQLTPPPTNDDRGGEMAPFPHFPQTEEGEGYSIPRVPLDGRRTSASGDWLGEILKLRLAGLHLADGTDPDEQVRQLREGWD